MRSRTTRYDGPRRKIDPFVFCPFSEYGSRFESLTKFSNDSYAWFQVGEVGYDIFMSRRSQG